MVDEALKVDPEVAAKSLPAKDDDMIRSIRFRHDNWKKMLDLVDRWDRSPNWIVNKMIADYGEEFPEPEAPVDPTGGVSTYMLQIEFQIQDVVDKDTHAYNVMSYIHDWLVQQTGVVASYPRIDLIGPMGYDERFGYKQQFGYSKLDPHNPMS